ncbi:MAG: DegT/DnrJ/EryC1/StrS family aminotransferase [Bacteroidales bacterium]|nr:DegT/DnrJ/EryC1/StrS family aminotransferase [Bacteroidales bacterium]
MDNIQMVDLKSQYQNIKTEIDTAIYKVIDSGAFINGPAVKEFAKNLEEYLRVKHVIPCANGTDALQIALMALGLKPRDEVITTDFTFIATVEVVALLGLKLKFVDVDKDTFNLIPEEVEKAITSKTKAIVPVHMFGQATDMEIIMQVAKKHNLHIIEDTAQAIGGEYTFVNGETKKLGTIGTIGCTSFFPSKNLGGFGDGGAIFTNDDELAVKLKQITNHGSKVKYYHDEIGVNSRLDSIQAAILNVKLKYLDNYISARQKAADFYDSTFKNHPKIKIPARDKNSTHVFHQYTIQLNGIDRNGLKEFLNKKDIPAMIYYPYPLHLQKAYKYLGYKKNDFPVTEELSNKVLSLPMHTELTEEQLKYITETVLEYADR